MNDTQIQEIYTTQYQITFDYFEHIKKINNIYLHSDQVYIQNLFTQTDIVWEKVRDNRISYEERSQFLHRLCGDWQNFRNQCESNQTANDLILMIDDITYSIMAYHKLLLGISHINENKTGDEQKDFIMIVSGYETIAQTLDIFVGMFSNSELKQIRENAQHTFLRTTPDDQSLDQYTKETANLRGYCSLIILRINEYLNQRELTSPETKKVNSSSSLWWENITGTFADDSLYDEAIKLGKEYRNDKNTFIKLKIEKLIEDENEYYVATSSDLDGLVAEGKTIKEVIDIAEDVARVLLELEKENNTDIITNNPPSIFEYPLILEA